MEKWTDWEYFLVYITDKEAGERIIPVEISIDVSDIDDPFARSERAWLRAVKQARQIRKRDPLSRNFQIIKKSFYNLDF